MSRSRCIERRVAGGGRAQRGDALLEALIGIVLVAILVLGSVYAASRIAVSQSQSRAQAMAIAQLRNLLQETADTGPWCDGAAPPAIQLRPANESLPPINLPVTASCTMLGSVTLNGAEITVPARIQLSVVSPTLFGGAGTVVVGDAGDT
jgi:prepilin peptidase dependent protein A